MEFFLGNPSVSSVLTVLRVLLIFDISIFYFCKRWSWNISRFPNLLREGWSSMVIFLEMISVVG